MADLKGFQLGNFTFTDRLGEGGMGVVYLAQHAFLERKKAVKVLSEEGARSSTAVRRFFDEAMAASACHHDHIVTIEDCGTLVFEGQPHPYIEMEYLEGENLGVACRREPGGRMADVDRAVKIAVYTADALGAAHARGIVHRDLKPENLFLTRRGSRNDYVKVLDFGIARLTGELSPGSPTRTGVVIGTPEYMSPEQASGLHPDGMSDVWSLGVVLYRMLVGRLPFVAENSALLAMKLRRDPPPPILDQRPDVPAGVARAIELALRKQPEERPTMGELQALLLDGDAAPRAVVPELSIPSSYRHVAHPVAAAADRDPTTKK